MAEPLYLRYYECRPDILIFRRLWYIFSPAPFHKWNDFRKHLIGLWKTPACNTGFICIIVGICTAAAAGTLHDWKTADILFLKKVIYKFLSFFWYGSAHLPDHIQNVFLVFIILYFCLYARLLSILWNFFDLISKYFII